MTRSETAQVIVNTLESAVRGRQILVLGSPGSGKTAFLDQLYEEISQHHRSWVAYRSGSASNFLSETFYKDMLCFLDSEGCLQSGHEMPDRYFSLTGFFKKLTPALYKDMVRHMVILVDDLDEDKISLEEISNLLSSVRGLYTEWSVIDTNVHFVFIGKVNIHKLFDLYKSSDSASWPLEQGKTILYLPNLTVQEINSILVGRSKGLSLTNGLYSNYIYELSNGDVYTVSQLLKDFDSKELNCQSIFDAAENLVHNMDWIQELEKRLSELSAKACTVLIKNLKGQFVCSFDRELEEELLLCGLFRKDKSNVFNLVNPIVERTFRKNWQKIKPTNALEVFGDLSELIPPVFCLNKTAYELISKIEMLLRNIAIVRLGENANGKHLLSGLNYELNDRTGLKEDQYFRSSVWRKQVSKSQYVDAHAALVSYTDTKDLLGLVDHLIQINDEVGVKLKTIRTQLNGMKEIRNAVMHGQIINEKSVENLYQIYNQLTSELTVKI